MPLIRVEESQVAPGAGVREHGKEGYCSAVGNQACLYLPLDEGDPQMFPVYSLLMALPVFAASVPGLRARPKRRSRQPAGAAN